jgi:5-methylthioadenosine/S-adenosylhomocysteine deaminase
MASPPLPGGGVLVKAGKIAALLNHEEFHQALVNKNHPIFLCENSLIVPGLFNLHCHLDYTNLSNIDDELPLFDWLEILVKRSRLLTSEDLLNSALQGAQEAALYGTSFLVDSTFSGMAALALAQTGLRGLVGLELFGLDHEKAQQNFDYWLQRYQDLAKKTELQEALAKKRLELTVAPHAPYTVCPALWQLALTWAKTHNKVLTAHLAESKAEIDWLCSKSLRLSDYLEKMLPPHSRSNLLKNLDWQGQGRGAIQHLAHHNLLDSSLLAAHLVHLQDAEFALLSQHSVKAAICARSNERLLNGQPQISKFKKAKLIFGLGSDSKASSPNLSMLDEAHFYAFRHKESLYETLQHLTLRSAQALGKEQKLGSLCPGKDADLAVFPAQALVDMTKLQSPAQNHPEEALSNEKIARELEHHRPDKYSPTPDLALLHYLRTTEESAGSYCASSSSQTAWASLGCLAGQEKAQSDKNSTTSPTRFRASYLWVAGAMIVKEGRVVSKFFR